MSILMMTDLPARIVQVLRDFMADELATLDTALGGGASTPVIPDGHYYDWDHPVPPENPSVTIKPLLTRPVGIVQEATGQPGRIHAEHHLQVKFHVDVGDTEGQAKELDQHVQRYIAAAAQVLIVRKWGLQTSADPTIFSGVQHVRWDESATYGPEDGQEEGNPVRTGTLPIIVKRVESR
jgi:hypothetical protein